MSININDLVESDKGRWVCYWAYDTAPMKKGRIKSWNDKYIFVVFHCDDDWDNYQNYTGCSVHPNNLHFSIDGDMDKPNLLENENAS